MLKGFYDIAFKINLVPFLLLREIFYKTAILS